jgi:hypothetical protein
MKKFSKIILISTLFLTSTSMLFALPEPLDNPFGPVYSSATDSYEVFSSHRAAMSGAGLGVTGFYDSYLYNPANISKDGFKLLTPTVTLTLNNVQNLLDPSSGADGIFEISERINNDEEITSQEIYDLIEDSTKSGYGEMLTTNVRTGLKFRNIGFNLEVQDKVRSYKLGIPSYYIGQMDIVASTTLGFNIPISDNLSIDVGGSVGFNYRVYSKGQTLETLVNLYDNETLSTNVPLAAGYSIPVNLGLNINLPLALTYSVVARNINDSFNFRLYSDAEEFWENDPTLVALFGQNNNGAMYSEEYTVSNDWQLDMGLTWAPDLWFIKPVIAYDVASTNELYQNIDDNDFADQLLEASSIGVQVSLLNLIDVRAGMSADYKSVGAGFDIPFLFHVDAAYSFMDLETNQSDALSIRVSLLSAK